METQTNILVSEKDHAVIADFGLSVFDEVYSREFHSARGGHEDWFAPEMRTPYEQPNRPTTAADVYSFALCCVQVGDDS